MANNLIITGGFGNGVFSGSIARIITDGYSIGAAAVGLSGKKPSVTYSPRYSIAEVKSKKTVVQVYD